MFDRHALTHDMSSAGFRVLWLQEGCLKLAGSHQQAVCALGKLMPKYSAVNSLRQDASDQAAHERCSAAGRQPAERDGLKQKVACNAAAVVLADWRSLGDLDEALD